MDYKKEMTKILDDLKKRNHSRRRIEEYLGYAPKTLDQLLSKGGNESILIKLREYKAQVDKGNIQNLPGHELYKDKKYAADRALIDVMLLEIAKLKSKVYGVSVENAIDELEQNAKIALRQAEKAQ